MSTRAAERRRRGAAPWGALVLLVLCGAPLQAQEQPGAGRSGFWFNVGAGPAWLDMDCGRCEQLPDSIPYAGGAGAHLRIGLGTTFSPRLRVGLGVAAAFRRSGERDATLLNLATLAQFHPRAGGPLFVRGGAGLSTSSLAGGGTLAEVDGFGLHGELGVEVLRLGDWSVAPYLGGMVGWNGNDTLSDESRGGLALDAPRVPRSVYLGIGATWR